MTTASKSAVTAVAAAMAAVLCTQMAYAAGEGSGITPTVVWSKNLGQSYTIDGKTYAVTLRDGTLNQDGTITVSSTWGDAAPYIDMDGKGVGTISILVKYSGLDINQVYNADALSIGVAFSSIVDSDTNVVGSCVQKVNGVANNTVRAYHCGATADSATPRDIGNMTAVEGTGYLLFSYKDSEGSRTYMGTSIAELTGGQDTAGHWSGKTLKKIVLGGDESGKAFNGAGYKIEEVALFVNEYYTASDVASYEFPSEERTYKSDVTVSTINTDLPNESEIDVYLADGVTVTGDTTFTATNVNFHCYGSFALKPPANNTATFDFFDVAGQPRIVYDGVLPTVVGTTFTSNTVPTFVTDSTQWTGTIWLKNTSITALDSNSYGNNESTLKFTNVTGYFAQNHVNTVPIELDGDGFYYDNGWGGELQTFSELKGSGMFKTGKAGNGGTIWVKKYSDFSGAMTLAYKKVVLGGSEPTHPNTNWGGQLVIADDSQIATVASGKTWGISSSVTIEGTLAVNGFIWASGGITVNGEIKAASLSNFGGGTYITTSDTGVFTLTSTGSPSDDSETDTSYARITGTGTLKYEGTGWRALSASNFPTNMTLVNEQAGDILLSRALTYTVGSFAGSKNIQGNYGSGDRYLRVLQAKNTEWSGKVVYDYYERFKGLIVAPGVSEAGTLTLSGAQTQSAALTVESGAKVNLTGTWVGATTVAGTLGGTGAITGDVTLSDGATLKVNDINDTLDVIGALTASSGTVTVDLPAGTPTQSGVKIISATDTITTGAKFKVTIDGEKTSLRVIKKSNFLKAVLPGLKIILR